MSILLDDDSRSILEHFIARSVSVAEAAERMAAVLSTMLDDAETNGNRFDRAVSAGYVRRKPSTQADASTVEPL